MPVHRRFYPDEVQFPVNGEILEHAGTAVGAGHTDHTFHRAIFHPFYRDTGKAAFHLIKNTDGMGPGIAPVLYHGRNRRGAAEIFGSVILFI